jgi:DNA-nicking Smr family endonuclease
MSARDQRRRRLLSKDERVLWKTFTKSIAPLRASPPEPDDAEHAAAPALPATSRAPKTAPVSAKVPARAEPKAPPPLIPLGRRLKQRVARGKESIDARLDLHGLTQSEAHAALLRFLRSASAREARLVLVITGKGRGGELGVLRRQVPHWLGLPEFRGYVIGFESAHISHGGEGALYVRVRRAR